MTYNELYQKMNHWTTMLEKGVVTLGVFNSAISFILQVYDRGPNKEMSKPSSSNSSLENPIMTPPSGAAESIEMPYSTKTPTAPLSDLAQGGTFDAYGTADVTPGLPCWASATLRGPRRRMAAAGATPRRVALAILRRPA